MNLYLDSMQWIYFFEQNPQFYPATRSLILRTQAAHDDLLSSFLVLAEVLVLPSRNRDLFMAAKYKRFFLSPAVSLVPFGADVAERFAVLRAGTRVKPADALHLALAASAGIDFFITTDVKLHSPTIPGISSICPPEAVPQNGVSTGANAAPNP
jgi:predicted nucleic acid-binding protein